MRAVARGWQVAVVQFVKSGEWKMGEEKIGRGLGVDWWAIGEGFSGSPRTSTRTGGRPARRGGRGRHHRRRRSPARRPRRDHLPHQLGLDRRRGRRERIRDRPPSQRRRHRTRRPGAADRGRGHGHRDGSVRHAYDRGIRARGASTIDPAGLTFLLGGARSGKSRPRPAAGHRTGRPVTFIATAEPRRRRDGRARYGAIGRSAQPEWTTVEEPIDVGGAVGRDQRRATSSSSTA